MLHRWLLDSWRYLSWVEYISLAGIALIIIQWGFIAGVLIGIVVGLATFALSVSRVHAIKFSFDGSEYHSSLDRRPDELAVLAEYGREVQGMFLHSYLFFGSANRLHQHVKALLAKQKCRFLLGIVVNGCSAPVRVRSLGPHTTIGEMGLITRQPRSATMQAELASVLYELSASAYERIKRENPALSHALLTYIITVMAERLSFGNRAIGVLQR